MEFAGILPTALIGTLTEFQSSPKLILLEKKFRIQK